MIAKPHMQKTTYLDPRQKAAKTAEGQMAHYLHLRFREDPEIHVLHDLRFEDEEQPTKDGAPGVCQIDHLVVHRWGMFIVESKSVAQVVRVRPDGSGGDEWSRVYGDKETGMASPIQQARRQSAFLRGFLQRHRQKLIGRMPVGLRTLAKMAHGSDQRTFTCTPIQLVIAVSDGGKIERIDGWEEPRKPFRVFVTKADLVADKIGGELERHRKHASLPGIHPTSEYGLWSMAAKEVTNVAELLAAHHTERSGAPALPAKQAVPDFPRQQPECEPVRVNRTAKAFCKHCGAEDLTAKWGPYGYHWQCRACGKNTKIPEICSACGTKGQSGKRVRIRKSGPAFFRVCEPCGKSEKIWINK